MNPLQVIVRLKIGHWVQLPKQNEVSGLGNTTSELIEAETKIIGEQNVGLLDNHPDGKKGGADFSLRTMTIKSRSWEWALEDDDCVNVIHTYPAWTIEDMKHKVCVMHGVPEYTWWEDIIGKTSVWWQIATLCRMSDATVCWFKRDVEFWQEMTEGKVVCMRRGVDLDYWKVSEREDPLMHPYLFYADAPRPIKYPFALFYAVKKVQRIHHNTYLLAVVPDNQIQWTNLLTRLQIDYFTPVVLGMIMKDEVRKYYARTDILVSPTYWGLTPRTVIEAMSCGDPVICFEGDEQNPVHGLRVEDSPEKIAEGIIKLWTRMEADTEGERIKARKCAEQHWNVMDTAKNLIKTCEEVI